MIRRFIRLLTLMMASVGTAILAANFANASQVTLQISGVVIEAGDSLLPAPVLAGMPFLAIVIYNLDVADEYPDNPNQSRFEQAPGLSSITINVNGMVFQSNGLSPTDVRVGNDLPIDIHIPESTPPPGDAIYWGWSGLTTPYLYDRTFIDLALLDHSASAFSSDQLPTSFDVDAFDVRYLNFLGIRELGHGLQEGTFLQMRPTSINVVPEPSTCGLVGAAILTFLSVPLRRTVRHAIS